MPPTPSKICLIEDDEIMGESLSIRFSLEGFDHDWHRSGSDALAALRNQEYGIVISDIRLPDITGDAIFLQLRDEHRSLPPFIFITGQSDIDTAVRLIKQGAQDYITKPFDLDSLIDRIRDIVATPGGELAEASLGPSPAMQKIEVMLHRLAGSTASVLITGESGVGKELVAQNLHELGGKDRPFIAVNCGALAESLVEAELFGYEKGAFTGAARTKKGVFEQADGGTLFLDEIGDMPLSMQVRLLRALQVRSIVRVGGEVPIPVNLRLICATHRDLKQRVGDGDFREDLYYRINVVQLRIPPLRERREDILWLAKRILRDMATTGCVPTLSMAAEQALMAYSWPGNVRELRNALERASLMSDCQSISLEHIFDRPAPRLAETQDMAGTLRAYLAECERDFIVNALNACHWQIQSCADSLGISRKTLWLKMSTLGIEKQSDD